MHSDLHCASKPPRSFIPQSVFTSSQHYFHRPLLGWHWISSLFRIDHPIVTPLHFTSIPSSILLLFPVAMSIIWYKRPDFVAKLPGPMNLTQCQIYVERTQKHKRAIPPELAFENVIQNKALPPCALQDFMVRTFYPKVQLASVLTVTCCRITWFTFLTTRKTCNFGYGFRITQRDSTRLPGRSRSYHLLGIKSRHRNRLAPSHSQTSLFNLFHHLKRQRNQVFLPMRLTLTTLILQCQRLLHNLISNLSFQGRQASPRPASQSRYTTQMPRWD